MMGLFPFGGNHWTSADLDDQVADGETGLFRHPHEIAVRPLRLVIVHHVGDLREQQAVRL